MADLIEGIEATTPLTGQAAVDGLIELLDLERIEKDIFRGRASDTPSLWQRTFGGQVAGQALVAAGRTVDPARAVHSLHSYFVRPGDATRPIVYEVDRVRDGGSFSTRRVIAVQNGETIFSLSASFQLEQDGVFHQASIPSNVPDPDTVISRPVMSLDNEAARMMSVAPRPLDLRWIDEPAWMRTDHEPTDTLRRVWMKADGVLPDDPLLHVCIATYASDLTLLDSVLVRQGLSVAKDGIAMASLDHAMWFHGRFRADEWLLYSTKSPVASGGRGLATGRFYTRDGRQVVSVAQEGMIRVRKD
jgi:acyl-CoA thioesterase-2